MSSKADSIDDKKKKDAEAEEEELHECIICKSPASFRCSRCAEKAGSDIRYCSADHQRLHWDTGHKERCGHPQPRYEPNVPLCDRCHERPADYLAPDLQSEGRDICLMCLHCGSLYCSVCTMKDLLGGKECAFCSVPCPHCGNPVGDSIGKDNDYTIPMLEALSNEHRQHKNRGCWNMSLGELYRDHRKDYRSAERCFLIAGEAGMAEAYTNIGNFYIDPGITAEGRPAVFPTDAEKALHYFKLAATPNAHNTKPDGLGAFNIGVMLSEGGGAQPDYKAAMEWYVKGAELGNLKACCNMGSILLDGNSTIRQNKKLAVQWFRRAAEGGCRNGQYRLARRYRDGDGVERNFQESRKWYETAANAGDVDSMYHMGQFYCNGWGVERNDDRAREWFERAAAHGDVYARQALERMNLGIHIRTVLPR